MKSHSLSLLSLIYILFAVGCTAIDKQAEVRWKERSIPNAISLQTEDSLVIRQPFNLLAWSINKNSIYFVTNGMAENFLSVYSYPECKQQFDFGKIGQGPGEFITLNAGEALENRLLLYDIMGRKALLFDTHKDTIHITARLPLYDDAEGLCKPFTNILQLDSDNYLMKVDDAASSAWEIADLKAKKTKYSFKNPYRTDKYSYTPFDFIQCVHDTTLLVAYKYMDKIDYYSIKDYQIHPLFTMGSDKNQADSKDYNYLMQYYLAVVPFGSLFYCLKSNDGIESGNLVEVYDMQGECKVAYALDKEVSSIRFDSSGLMVGYAADVDQTTLYRFRLGGE